MYYIKEIEHEILLAPKYLSSGIVELIRRQVQDQLEGSCSGKHGYIIAVLDVAPNPTGVIQNDSTAALFKVNCSVLVMRPFKGEVIDAIVTSVTKLGIRADFGPLDLFISSYSMPSDFSLNEEIVPPVYTSQEQPDVVITAGSKIRLKIVGTKIENSKITAVGTIKEDYLDSMIKKILVHVQFDDESQLKALLKQLKDDIGITDHDIDSAKISRLTEGVTNLLYKCEMVGVSVLVRIYGEKTEKIICRNSEIANFERLSTVNLAPRIYSSFENGIVYEYVDGFVPKHQDLSTYSIYISRKLREWHSIPTEGEELILESRIKSWVNVLMEVYDTDMLLQIAGKTTHELLRESNELLETLREYKCRRILKSGFCHNDLLLPNIIVNTNEGSPKVTFIDYEYSGLNYVAFDIANHFCEYAGLNCLYTLLPEEKERREWLKHYLNSCDYELISQLDQDIVFFYQFVHFLWSLWSLLQAKASSIDFDYIGYFKKRYNQYLIESHGDHFNPDLIHKNDRVKGVYTFAISPYAQRAFPNFWRHDILGKIRMHFWQSVRNSVIFGSMLGLIIWAKHYEHKQKAKNHKYYDEEWEKIMAIRATSDEEKTEVNE